MEAMGPTPHGGDAGNFAPVKIAGRTQTSLPSPMANGRVSDVALDAYGRAKVVLENTDGSPFEATPEGLAGETGAWTESTVGGNPITKLLVIGTGAGREVLRFAAEEGNPASRSFGFLEHNGEFGLYSSASEDDTGEAAKRFTVNGISGEVGILGTLYVGGGAGITYDNADSGLTATNVKAAIDELKALIDGL